MMPPRVKNQVKKTKIKSEESKVSKTRNEKKDEVSQQRIQCTKNYSLNGTQHSRDSANSEELFEKLLSSPMKQIVKLKPLSFWSKKLKDLEGDKNMTKNMTKLYEFSASEDSFKPNKERKKGKKKYVAKKKKQPTEFPIIEKKINKAKVKEYGQVNKENNVLINKSDTFPFTKAIPFLTSTPAPIRQNIVDNGNFQFLSPIEKREVEEEMECDDKIKESSSNSKTPKIKKKNIQKRDIRVDAQQSSEVRVLRSRKILIP